MVAQYVFVAFKPFYESESPGQRAELCLWLVSPSTTLNRLGYTNDKSIKGSLKYFVLISFSAISLMNYSRAIAEKEKKCLYLGFFVSSSNTADVGREEETGDDPRLLLPRDPPKVFFLPSALASLMFLPGFCFSFFAFSDFFVEPIFAAGAMGTDSVPGSSSGSTSSNTSVLKSCPRNATLQNGVRAAKKPTGISLPF